MMEIRCYQIDAFTDEVFKGNPAGVCPLEDWLPDDMMLNIAAENSVSETAFLVQKNDGFHIRWFSPVTEVDLCGHATLAGAYVVFNYLNYNKDTITFFSKSGELRVKKEDNLLQLDFPVQKPVPCELPEFLIEGLGKTPVEVLRHADYIAVYENESDIRSMAPDYSILNKIEIRGICITAPGTKTDFVSRFFAPRYGINEDPVTGSAHCELTPYWAERLNKNKFTAAQLSKRGGALYCELNNDRVLISGKAVTYLEGKIKITGA